ncbi:hypothetical protein QZH41_017732 [Actinostola sp. cb2023]|nr:hypothetical protein QZH41_017732 [Actinostola sp. cb2023]
MLEDVNGGVGSYCIVQYSFTGDPHPIDLRPHKNAKDQMPKRICQNVSNAYQSQFLDEIFGVHRNDEYHPGLIYCGSKEDYIQKCKGIQSTWTDAGDFGLKAWRWFAKNKLNSFFNCLGASAREQAGLGRPPERFITNPSEGNNKLVQDFVRNDIGKKRVNEHEFSKALQKLVQRQDNDLEMAVFNQGPYKFRAGFEHLAVSEDNWLKMRPKQRENALKSVHQESISLAVSTMALQPHIASSAESNPLLNELVKEGIDWIPVTTLDGISKKATLILEDRGQIIEIPNSGQSLMIPSKSNPRNPHVVNALASGRVQCNCAHNKSLSLCSHALVYVKYYSLQRKYFAWLKQRRRKHGQDAINLSSLLTERREASQEKECHILYLNKRR